MEVIFELLFEIFGEVLLQILYQALAEAGLHFFRRPGGETTEAKIKSPWLLAIGYATFGAITGVISVMVHPGLFIHSQLGRIANLVLGPVAAGLSMALIGAWRQRRGQQVLGLDRFAYGYVFALAMAAVRFYGTQ